MDYRVRRSPKELESTGYMEIGPGKYSGTHWQEGFLFVWEDAFGMAEGILTKRCPAYDHFAMNDIPKDIGHKVTSEWRRVASKLSQLSSRQAYFELNLAASYRERMKEELKDRTGEIAEMLSLLADSCEFYDKDDWICVLGM